jgi:hypothetical protein
MCDEDEEMDSPTPIPVSKPPEKPMMFSIDEVEEEEKSESHNLIVSS